MYKVLLTHPDIELAGLLARKAHVNVADSTLAPMVAEGLLTPDEDGDLEVPDLTAAATFCFLRAHELRQEAVLVAEEKLMQEYAETAQLLHRALQIGGGIIAVEMAPPVIHAV